MKFLQSTTKIWLDFGFLDFSSAHTSWVPKGVSGIILLYTGQHNYAAQKKNYTHSKQCCAQNPAYAQSPKGNKSKDKELTQKEPMFFRKWMWYISYFKN